MSIASRLENFMNTYKKVCDDVLEYTSSGTYKNVCYADTFYRDLECLRKLAQSLRSYPTNVKWLSTVNPRFLKLKDEDFDSPYIMRELLDEVLTLMESIKYEDLHEYISNLMVYENMRNYMIYRSLSSMCILLVLMSPFQMLVQYGTTVECMKRGVPNPECARGVYDYLTNYGYVTNLKYIIELLKNPKYLNEYADLHTVEVEATVSIGTTVLKLLQDAYYSDANTSVGGS